MVQVRVDPRAFARMPHGRPVLLVPRWIQRDDYSNEAYRVGPEGGAQPQAESGGSQGGSLGGDPQGLAHAHELVRVSDSYRLDLFAEQAVELRGAGLTARAKSRCVCWGSDPKELSLSITSPLQPQQRTCRIGRFAP